MIKHLLIIIGISSSFLHAEITFNKNAWATHQPVLYEIAARTTGAILEFGCGDNSTDMLHEICKKEKRLLISMDDNYDWIQKFKDKYLHDGYEEDNSGWHKFFYVAKKPSSNDASHWMEFLNSCALLKNLQIDLCFIDQSPWEARTETVMRFKDKAKYIILHDCDYFTAGQLGKVKRQTNMKKQEPGTFDFGKTFTHFKVFFPSKPWACPSGPPTLLGSNLEELPFDIVSQ